ncbi:DEAD/DEAH box helicase [Desertivirga arenae]|uniref:DEAD/DEAH box helicase n=1 Tax=Desertivirga arenae TaxID=2810309 RepID=UPI001F61E96E|nr:DEAD/DEAH box helicase [Pedobacter sp. SYSU D00823]
MNYDKNLSIKHLPKKSGFAVKMLTFASFNSSIVWAEKFKLSKQLVRSVTEAGFLYPTEVQQRTLSRILGGQDIIAIAPEGAGKTSIYIIGILSRLKYGFEEAPRALILVPDKDRVLQVMEQIDLLNKNKTIRIVGLYAGPSIETQVEEVTDGVDIIVATPDRARAVYLKLGLNVNKIQTMVVDDAELIVKQGLQLPVVELANSIGNCQHLIFSEVFHEKLEKMIDPFMRDPAFIEVDELSENSTETLDQILYHVPNFKTKQNLLQLLLEDEEVFTKAIVFVNTRLSAEKVYQSLHKKVKQQTAVLNPISFESTGFSDVEEFEASEDHRILIVADELKAEIPVELFPFIIHVELPQEKEVYISRVIKPEDSEQDTMAITFTTDLELGTVRKIEQAIGKKIETSPLPDDLLIVQNFDSNKGKSKTKLQPTQEPRGEAFHEKKASNAKDYNLGAGVKAKMTKKKKH